MAVDPLALAPASDPTITPVLQPGFFDGQMPSPDINMDMESIPQVDMGSDLGIDTPPPPPVEEQQVAGLGSMLTQPLKRLLKGGAKTETRIGDIAGQGPTSGEIGPYTVFREASPDEVLEFQTLTGKTSGAPSPTRTQRAEGIPTAEFNLENIDGPDALKATIDNISTMWTDAGRAAGRGKMTFEETKSLADDMGLGPTVERLLKRADGTAFNAEEITASLQAVATSAMELNRLAKIAATTTDTRDLLKFRQHLSFHSAIQIQMKGAQVEAGRALAAFRIPRGVGPEVDAQALQDIMGEFGGANSVRDMAKSFLALPTQAQRNKFTYSAYDKVKGAWFEIWINGLLSAPGTHVVNMAGNAVFQAVQIPERLLAGMIGQGRQVLGSKAERIFMQESVADIIGLVQGIGDGFRLAKEAWKTEAPVRDVVSKIESASRRMITAENLGVDSENFFGKGINYLGTAIRLPGRALMAEDEFYKGIAYRRELNSLATRRALELKRNGATPDEIAEALEDIMMGKNTEISTAAEDFAAYATFTNPAKGSIPTIAAGLQSTLIGRMLVPFFKTPYNILLAGLERSPIGFIQAIANAKDPIKRDMLISRASLGTGVMAWAGSQYVEGNITGSGPSDTALRKQMESIGWKRWSMVTPKEGIEKPRWIQIGHTQILHPDDVQYTSYARLEPVSFILSVATDTTERFRWPTASQTELEQIGLSAVDVIFSYMKDQSVLSGFADIASIITSRNVKALEQGVAQSLQRIVGSQIPYSSLLANIERVSGDPTMESIIPDRNIPMGLRDLYAGLRKMDGRNPFAESEDGAPILKDRFGQPRLQKGTKVREAILPPFISDIMGQDEEKIKADPVMLEILAAGIPLTMPKRKIDSVPLTAKEYDVLVTFAAAPPPVMVGNRFIETPTFYEAMAEMTSDESWAELKTPDKQTLIKGLDSDYKAIAKDLILYDERYAEQFADLRQKVEAQRNIRENAGRQIQ